MRLKVWYSEEEQRWLVGKCRCLPIGSFPSWDSAIRNANRWAAA